AGDADFHRVLDRADVARVVVEDVQRGVQRHGLARAGRAGDQHHAVGLLHRVEEQRLLVVLVAELLDAQLGGAAVEHAQHDLLAEQGRQGADAEVDLLALAQVELDAAVLRHPLLGDVELRHHLQARGDARAHLHRDLGDLLEDAVDAQAHAVVGLVGLEVDVRGALADGVHQHLVDELDDRRVVALGVHAGVAAGLVLLAAADVEVLEVLVLVVAAHRRVERLGRLEPLVDGGADALLVHQYRLDLEVGLELDLVEGAVVGRVGDADEQLAAALEHRQHAVLADQLLAHQLDRRLRRVHGADVEHRDAEGHRVGGGHLDRRHQLVVDQVLGQRAFRDGRGLHGLPRGRLVQRPVDDELPGDAGDADQVGVQRARHREDLLIPHWRLYPKPGRLQVQPPSHPHTPFSPQAGRRWPEGPDEGRFSATLSPKGKPMHLSIILPAKNEAPGLRQVLPGLRARYPEAEVIVVDDGSTDETAAVAAEHGARVLSSPYPMGNGAAIKHGARAAGGEVLVFMDADGQHDPALIPRLLDKLEEGYDRVVGARDGSAQASAGLGLANAFYNRLASWMTGHRVADLTSGFWVARAERFRQFLHLLPNG